MSDDIFDFDIDAELAKAAEKTEKKAAELPEIQGGEEDCEGCKI